MVDALNERKARDIKQKWAAYPVFPLITIDGYLEAYHEAKGYLLRCEQDRAVIEAARNALGGFWTNSGWSCFFCLAVADKEYGDLCHKGNCLFILAQKALAEFDRGQQ